MARVGKRDLLRLVAAAPLAALARGAPRASRTALDLRGLPFRQDDPAWGREVVWRRAAVLAADVELNGHPAAHGPGLLRAFDDGNTIANEGCLLTCLAMVLRLFQPDATPGWTPGRLNAVLAEEHVVTPSGLSLAPLTLDVVSDLTRGEVQQTAREEYLPGVDGRRRVSARTSALLRAYRGLPPTARSDVVVMVKTGTWDDTVASHYLLVHPGWSGVDDDVEVLDPAMPAGATGPWRLSDSARVITRDEDIARAWREARITPRQLAGVWAFTRTPSPGQARLVKGWSDALLDG
ncbi:MAG: hypothetical protein INH41_10170 [Myxococcaceae bacterium]|jgi:hypothetical protein|nr:hypothetical protein [Myxococcaceae bacterium]